MKETSMGKVLVTIKLENIEDALKASKGELPPDQVRTVEVSDAVVDTGATMLLVPKGIIERLGLAQLKTRPSRGLGGTLDIPIFNAVRLTIQGRVCTIDVGAIPDQYPVLIGQVPLEILDWVVDPARRRLIGNPDHDGEEMIEVFFDAQ
jgi:predicted aspartyl protease